MIQVNTKTFVADNTGARTARCIKILGGSNKKSSSVGELILITVQKLKKTIIKKKIQRKKVYLSCIIRTTKNIKRFDGSYINFIANTIIILNKEKEPLGNRLVGPIVHEFRLTKFIKILALSNRIL